MRNIQLFILMRTDLESLNPGKAMAQAAHAGNMLSEAAHAFDRDSHEYRMYQEWLGDGDFGTTIVLGDQNNDDLMLNESTGQQDLATLNACLDMQQDSDKIFIHGMVHDPTYPVKDGGITHLVPLDTCVWVLCDANDSRLAQLRENFELHH